MPCEIVDLLPSDEDHVNEIAQFLYECFRKYAPEWVPDLESCKKEIQESFQPGRRSRVLLTEDGRAAGWIGAITDEHLWEIHPIAVSPQDQRLGYGRMLVTDFISLAKESGAVAVWAGTSDETHSTSFSRIDLYRNASTALENFNAPEDHPVNFWSKVGFSLVGVMPDEEGLGKPGIHFAKRIEEVGI